MAVLRAPQAMSGRAATSVTRIPAAYHVPNVYCVRDGRRVGGDGIQVVATGSSSRVAHPAPDEGIDDWRHVRGSSRLEHWYRWFLGAR
jgi:hypothetical protein